MSCAILFSGVVFITAPWPRGPSLTFLNYISEAFEIHLTKFDFVLLC